MSTLLLFLLLVLVAGLAVAPLLTSRQRASVEQPLDETRRELEDRELEKLRELRDLEADRLAGKISDAQFREESGRLKQDALGLINELEELRSPKKPSSR